MPLLPLWTFVACSRVNFSFIFITTLYLMGISVYLTTLQPHMDHTSADIITLNNLICHLISSPVFSVTLYVLFSSQLI